MFEENYIIMGQLICKTGVHIGDTTDGIDIGGSDLPIVKNPISGYPYIPGSSLKGKLRYLIELTDKKSSKSVIENNGWPSTDEECIAAKLFGTNNFNYNNDSVSHQTRIIVRDSQPTDDTIKLWNNYDELYDGVELKWENIVNRITNYSTPRNIERIPMGSIFNFEIIYSVYSNDDAKDIVKIFEAMKLLENNYLGGSGSRGSGQVKFDKICVSKRDLTYYTENNEEKLIVENMNIDEVIDIFNKFEE